MFKFMILFNKPAVPKTFENSYNDFLALVERMPEIRRRQVINVQGSPAGTTKLFRILEVYFDDQAAMEEALRSEAGQEAGAELRRFRQGSYELIFAEVFEEDGGQTAEDAAPDNVAAEAAEDSPATENSEDSAEE
jgi:uncharacterized protein (TIGR02118 family)